MFDYEHEPGRPKGRLRTLPEIPETPYTKHILARREKISRSEYVAEWVKYGLKKCPSPSEALVTTMLYSPYIIGAGAIAVGAADQIFNLGIAQDLSHIKVNKHDGPFKQLIEQILHDIGEGAKDAQK